MCESHSEDSLLPILAWKLRMMKAGAQIALKSNALRADAPEAGGDGKPAKKKNKANAAVKTTK